MWFATGVETTNQLSTVQLSSLDLYKQVDPFIRSLFFGGSDPFMHTFSYYITSNASSSMMTFEFPSRYSETFNNINFPTLDAKFRATIVAYQNNNFSFISVLFV